MDAPALHARRHCYRGPPCGRPAQWDEATSVTGTFFQGFAYQQRLPPPSSFNSLSTDPCIFSRHSSPSDRAYTGTTRFALCRRRELRGRPGLLPHQSRAMRRGASMHVALLQQYACSVQPETQRCTAILGASAVTMPLSLDFCTQRRAASRNKPDRQKRENPRNFASLLSSTRGRT